MTEQERYIADFFEVGEFAEYLGLTVADLIYMFPNKYEEALPEIEELMGIDYERRKDT